MNQLGQESDTLDEHNKYLDSKILQYRDMMEMTNTDFDKKIHENESKAEHLRDNITTTNEVIFGVEDHFMQIQKISEELVAEFETSRISAKVAPHQTYDEHTQFTENNVAGYLAEIEECVGILITQTAHSKGDPNAPNSSMPLSDLPRKDWQKKEIFLDEQFDPKEGATTYDDDESVTDERNMRLRYEEKFEKNTGVRVGGNRSPDL